jgi:hypothetical protein
MTRPGSGLPGYLELFMIFDSRVPSQVFVMLYFLELSDRIRRGCFISTQHLEEWVKISLILSKSLEYWRNGFNVIICFIIFFVLLKCSIWEFYSSRPRTLLFKFAWFYPRFLQSENPWFNNTNLFVFLILGSEKSILKNKTGFRPMRSDNLSRVRQIRDEHWLRFPSLCEIL